MLQNDMVQHYKRGHIKSQYLQIVRMISTRLRGILCPLKATNFLRPRCMCGLDIQAYNSVLLVGNKGACMRTRRGATGEIQTAELFGCAECQRLC